MKIRVRESQVDETNTVVEKTVYTDDDFLTEVKISDRYGYSLKVWCDEEGVFRISYKKNDGITTITLS